MNNDTSTTLIRGTVQRGHRVASGLTSESPYPRGTISMQAPFFQALEPLLDLSAFYLGTLNVGIAPCAWELKRAWRTFPQILWCDTHPPEDFFFMRCGITFRDQSERGYVYYPSPETKVMHFHNASILEILAPKIEGITYGDAVEIEVYSEEIFVR
jgi:phage terminase large subunit-like protein